MVWLLYRENILSKEFITVWGHLGRNFVTFLPNEKNVTISNWLNALKIPKSFQSDFYFVGTYQCDQMAKLFKIFGHLKQ